MGKKRQANRSFHILLSDADYTTITQIAKNRGETVSGTIRSLIRDAISDATNAPMDDTTRDPILGLTNTQILYRILAMLGCERKRLMGLIDATFEDDDAEEINKAASTEFSRLVDKFGLKREDR